MFKCLERINTGNKELGKFAELLLAVPCRIVLHG